MCEDYRSIGTHPIIRRDSISTSVKGIVVEVNTITVIVVITPCSLFDAYPHRIMVDARIAHMNFSVVAVRDQAVPIATGRDLTVGTEHHTIRGCSLYF